MQRLRQTRPRRLLDQCGSEATPHDRLRARLRRATPAEHGAAPLRPDRHHNATTDGITLSTPRGACEIVTNPNDLWPAAQGLAKCSIDLPQPLQFD